MTTAEIKFVKSLSSKKFRDETGLFCVEGEKMVAEAQASPFTVRDIYRIEDIGAKAMERISALSSPSPVLAVVEQHRWKETVPSEGLWLALDGIRDPGNMGTILRLAGWFGVKGIVTAPGCVELYNPKVVQATMGAIFRVPCFEADLPSWCHKATEAGGRVFGTFLDGKDIYGEDLSGKGPCVIVIGNESEGISPSVAAAVTDRLFIPRWPKGSQGVESLNAAVATGITIAEFRRRQ